MISTEMYFSKKTSATSASASTGRAARAEEATTGRWRDAPDCRLLGPLQRAQRRGLRASARVIASSTSATATAPPLLPPLPEWAGLGHAPRRSSFCGTAGSARAFGWRIVRRPGDAADSLYVLAFTSRPPVDGNVEAPRSRWAASTYRQDTAKLPPDARRPGRVQARATIIT